MIPTVPPLVAENHMCGQCRFAYASVSIETALERIREVPEHAATALVGVSDERLRARPSADTWSALEYLCHLRDVYAVYTIRLYRTRLEDGPMLEPMLNDLRVVRFRYNQRELRPVLAELVDNVAGSIDEAARNTEQTWDRVARRLPEEQRTARWLIRQAAHEGLHHLRDIVEVLRPRQPNALVAAAPRPGAERLLVAGGSRASSSLVQNPIGAATKSQLTYAAAVRPGDEIIRDGRGSIVTAVQRARGRKPKVGENLHLITEDDIIKANSTSPVRLLRKH